MTTPGQQSPFHYGPAKAGLVQLTRHLAAELGPHRIRVNALVPGPFPSQAEAEFGERLAARTMLGRLGARQRNRRSAAVPGLARLQLHHRLSPDGGWWLDRLVIKA